MVKRLTSSASDGGHHYELQHFRFLFIISDKKNCNVQLFPGKYRKSVFNILIPTFVFISNQNPVHFIGSYPYFNSMKMMMMTKHNMDPLTFITQTDRKN